MKTGQRKPVARAKARSKGSVAAPAKTEQPKRILFCDQFAQITPVFPPDVGGARLEAIVTRQKEWANGTVLKYFLFKDKTKDGGLAGVQKELDAVRRAFEEWKDLGIGLEFSEVQQKSEAELRIGFQKDGRSWSYVGRDNLEFPGTDEPTMNLGWDVVSDFDTILHEIGHAMGLNHEHQNPRAGIVWDEPAVIAEFSGPPNSWDEDTIRRNILDKLPQSSVKGTRWDKDSIMHYPFPAGLIKVPAVFQQHPLQPKGGLSNQDKKWAVVAYPPLASKKLPALAPHKSAPLLDAIPGQSDFAVRPTETREYRFQKFGESDGVMVLFEEVDGQNWFLAGDNDAGLPTNATLAARLRAGREYTLRVKIHFAPDPKNLSVMMW
jgi:hypothetical protein